MIGVGQVPTLTTRQMMNVYENRKAGIPFSDSAARTVAMWWQSSGTVGSVLAAFASGMEVDENDFLTDIYNTRKANPESKDDMDILDWWVLNRRLCALVGE